MFKQRLHPKYSCYRAMNKKRLVKLYFAYFHRFSGLFISQLNYINLYFPDR